MRLVLPATALALTLFIATPAQGQLRGAAPQAAPVQLYDTGGSGFLLNTVFNPEHFSMRHSFEMSVGSGSGFTSSLAMYTNSLIWDFGNKLAARADIAVAYSPFGSDAFGLSTQQGPRVFLRRAEVDYRPFGNLQLNVTVRQSPYGRYAVPYGYFNGIE